MVASIVGWYAAAGAVAGRRADVEPVAGSSSVDDPRVAPRNAPSRQAMNRATETTATMIVEIALICGVTPNLIEL